MSENKATWVIELNTECPHCKEYVDLLDAADFWDGRNYDVPEHNTPRTTDAEVQCPKCDETFEVDFEY